MLPHRDNKSINENKNISNVVSMFNTNKYLLLAATKYYFYLSKFLGETILRYDQLGLQVALYGKKQGSQVTYYF